MFPNDLTDEQRSAWESWFNDLMKRGPVYTYEEDVERVVNSKALDDSLKAEVIELLKQKHSIH